jgi:hypothetical protein
MKFATSATHTVRVRDILHGILQPGQATQERLGQFIRQGLAVVLSALIIVVPMGQSMAFAQVAPAPTDNGQAAPQPLAPDQLDQMVAPIALYPDALVAQVLAGATYPTQIVDADRWRQAQGNASPAQIAAGANSQNWDPSVKALTAFPTVLAQMDKNLQWTTDLGNAYYNQPQDVMDAVQALRQKAEAAGQLRSTPQLAVNNDNGVIAIAPADPAVVYVPVYNPWAVYGVPIAVYPGFYWAPPYGIAWSGVGIAFGVGIGIAAFASVGWGWGHWGVGWHDHSVVYNHGHYSPHNPGGYGRGGIYARGGGGRGGYGRGGGFNRGGGYNRGGSYARGGGGFNRGGASRGGSYARGGRGSSVGRSSATSRTSASRSSGTRAGAGRATTARSSGAGRASGGTSHTMASRSGGGHATTARSSGGGHPSGGGAPHAMASHSGGGGGRAMGGGGHAGGGGGHAMGGGGHAGGGGGHAMGGGGHAMGGGGHAMGGGGHAGGGGHKR